MEKSKLLKLNWKDLGKSIMLFLITSVIAGLYALIETGELFNKNAIIGVLSASLLASISYLLKNLLTNSEDKVLIKE